MTPNRAKTGKFGFKYVALMSKRLILVIKFGICQTRNEKVSLPDGKNKRFGLSFNFFDFLASGIRNCGRQPGEVAARRSGQALLRPIRRATPVPKFRRLRASSAFDPVSCDHPSMNGGRTPCRFYRVDRARTSGRHSPHRKWQSGRSILPILELGFSWNHFWRCAMST